jgi:alanyl-tRNA synthetase
VDDDLLRFDFTNPSALAREELHRIEDEVNARIVEAAPIAYQKLPLAEARKAGAMMLFGEKYPDVVRVVSVGQFSKELCGGTHLCNSGQIGLCKILSDESVSAGTRRITALTGKAALNYVRQIETALAATAAALRVAPAEVPQRVASLVKDFKQLKKQHAASPKGEAATVDQLLAGAEEQDGVKIVIAEVPSAGPQVLRQWIDQLRKQASPIAIFLGSPQEEGKVMLVAGLSRDLVERGLDAVRWVKAAAKLVGGGGGGRPDMAQAGGKDATHLAAALETARSEIRAALVAGGG